MAVFVVVDEPAFEAADRLAFVAPANADAQKRLAERAHPGRALGV